MTKKEFSLTDLEKVLEARQLEQLSGAELLSLFENEKQIAPFRPDGPTQVDPRDGTTVVYSSARAKRPHDNKGGVPAPPISKPCPICEGNTTGVIDVAELSLGFTFINKNLFPCVYLNKNIKDGSQVVWGGGNLEGNHAHGLHLLQWTSSVHHNDWHNMPISDLRTVVARLGVLEQKLLYGDHAIAPATHAWSNGVVTTNSDPSKKDSTSNTSPSTPKETAGFVSIIKNVGAPVGGSLVHGHQQIVFSNIMPKRMFDNWRFLKEHQIPFSKHLLNQTPTTLVVKDLGPATLVVPYFMRRPYDMMLVINDSSKQYIHELNEAETTAVAEGWAFCAKSYQHLLPALGREFAYNAVVHNGPGAGLYFEFLPFTQETGGLEQLGLVVCQNNPNAIAQNLRELRKLF